ncbi:hypothetical protein GCM10010915_20050 [Microbacterium faecale]|uniref:Uncharacterized protein n=1 Tax=Microbacterium faecale TaxID=1804630 RepID=A0A916YBU3_9MICO|nr:hypothetical protein GCM10010915_20050 [Microbacterium faecale]
MSAPLATGLAGGSASADPGDCGAGKVRAQRYRVTAREKTPDYADTSACSCTRTDRLTADTIALSEAVAMSPSTPTPHSR